MIMILGIPAPARRYRGLFDINILRKAAAVVMAVVICINLCGCGGGDLDKNFKYNISANPGTLDPQQANDSISDMIIGNVYLGLLRIAEDGSVVNGAAYEYSVSEDGLVYNFKLREDIYWMSVGDYEAQCTARDFVYGFKRLFLPETQAVRAAEYFCIKNSESFHENGTASLGVVAKGDFELEITLDYPNPRFPAMLSEPPAMPCCEEFFLNAQGKYGLSASCTPSNGAFYVRTWQYSRDNTTDGVNRLVLSRNSKNAEALEICPSNLNFYIRNENRHIKDFIAGNTDCIAVTNDDRERISGKYNCDEFSSISCGLVFNREFAPFRNDDFRKAMTLLADRDEIASAVSEFDSAQGIVPDYVSIDGKSYREEVGGCTLPEYDPQRARELFQAAKPQLDLSLFTGARVIVCSAASRTAASYILQEWQREFGFYCTVETLNETDFKARLQKGSYEIAVVELSGKYNSPAAYLEQFCGGNIQNYGRFSDSVYDEMFESANESVGSGIQQFKAAEQYLIDNSAFLPLFSKNEYFITNAKSSDIVYNPFSKTIDFSKAKMK